MACWLIYGLLLGMASLAEAKATGRHISIIVDTSGSKLGSDPRRYTLQLSQILADLSGKEDSLSIIRLPQSEHSCADAANAGLSRPMNQADRNGFQQSLDALISYGGDNFFAAPIHTAEAELEKYPEKSRLLLFIADSGGLGNCNAELSAELTRLKAQGVMIAAINMGGLGAFDHNPAFTFTKGAMNAEELVESVAEVYQHFIGGKQAQTGRVEETIEVDIAPLARQAFLVIAADGAMTGVEAVTGNPAAEQVELNHQGGGQALGLDGRRRDYRIVRLQRPEAGRWRFKATGLSDPAGWMLLQDSALGFRLMSPPKLAQGIAAPLQVEVYDLDTGQRVADTSRWPGLEANLSVEGQTFTFRDNGQDGDRKAGDGILTALVTLNQLGKHTAPLRLQSDTLDRSTEIEFQVDKIGWLLEAQVPAKAEVGNPLNLTVQAKPNLTATSPVPLRVIEANNPAGVTLASLHDDGLQGDKQAGDGLFSGVFTPLKTGDLSLSFMPQGGSGGLPTTATVKIVGSIKFPPAEPVQLGRTGSHGERQSNLDLSAAVVKGEFPLELSSDFAAPGSVLEIDLGSGWVALDDSPRLLLLEQTGTRLWPVRLRTGDCPTGVTPDQGFSIQLKGLDADDRPLHYAAPLKLEIIEDPWLHCWWPLLATLAGGLLAGIIIHGFWSPSRFSPRLGVVLSPEEDMGEGFFHPIRAQRGTGSGFYRDARVHIRQDFRLSGSGKGSIACLRASGKRVYIHPTGGSQLLRQNLDGDWEPLAPEETPVHFGMVYKDAMGGLFFEIRNG